MPKYPDRCYHTVWMFLGLYIFVGALGLTGQAGEDATNALMVIPSAVKAGEVWRLVTYAFLTGGGLNLFFNVLIFYFIGLPLELVWGTRRFLTVTLVSIIGGGLAATLLGVPLAGGWAVAMTLMLIHGFLFPESIIYAFFFFPMRVKTFAILMTVLFLVQCVSSGFVGLALFAGLFCGVLYYVFTTRSIPWIRRAKRRVAQVAANPVEFVGEISAGG